jgi:hypothetical protein
MSAIKPFKTIEELEENLRDMYPMFSSNGFTYFHEMYRAAKEHFNSVTAEYEDRETYYNNFGLTLGDVHADQINTESFYIEDHNYYVAVNFYQFYIDSAVNEEDYFKAYWITM